LLEIPSADKKIFGKFSDPKKGCFLTKFFKNQYFENFSRLKA
jgi:hypothetical protein